MSSSGPSSPREMQGSSLAFVKPMPKRDDCAAIEGSSSAIATGRPSESGSSAELWPEQLPFPADSRQQLALAGYQLGHFRIVEQIGRGGMGAVFRAVDTRLDRLVALKVLATTQSGDPNSVERFRNEARAAARMDNDNIARVYYVGESQGVSFIAFEFVQGANVRQLIEQQGALKPADAVNYSLQIASALRHTDAAGVVHRDIKPSNIIITPAGRAKLVDLGLARKRDPQVSNDLTVDGTTLGTFDYISPEQAKDPRNVDVRSDIYSLGCTLYHMLTGEPPYPVGTMLQKLLDHQGKNIPDASARNSEVPADLSAVVRKMMASEPDERYASPELLIDDLSVIAHQYGLRPTPAEGLVWSTPGKPPGWHLWKRYAGWIAAAALLLIVVLVIDRAPFSSVARQPPRVFPPQGATPLDRKPDFIDGQDSGRIANSSNWATPDSPANATAIASAAESAEPPAPPTPEETAANEVGPATPAFTPSPLSKYLRPFIPDAGNPFDLSEGLFSFDPRTGEIIPPGHGPSVTVAPEPNASEGTRAAEERIPAPTPTPPKAKPFVVIANGVETGYATLDAACAAAPEDAMVELQFDGEPLLDQQPLRIKGKRLRIRAARDYRPQLRFTIPAERLLAGREETVSLLTVLGGALELYNVDITVSVDPRLNIGRWAVFSLSEADHLELHGVSITLENESLRPAAVIELAETPRPAYANETPTATRVNAENCFFRGEGDLILDRNVDPARIRLRNVAVALDGGLLRLEGTDAYLGSTDMHKGHDVELELRHVTAVLRDGVANFDVQPTYAVPKLAVDAGDSVISASAPLIRMQGDWDVRDFQDWLTWSDDATFLYGPSPAWQISTFQESRDYDRDEFDATWGRNRQPLAPDTESLSGYLSVRSELRYSQLTDRDLRLDADLPWNPALRGASDGTDAGVDWSEGKLPRLQPDHGVHPRVGGPS